ncbi:hypothetical protein DFJ73DRAFT_811578 [Zopfochytrium polystomum]|nr:hypothetical protein DFJ73DRAFT_811578 [Zopfochytrium polystomum]
MPSALHADARLRAASAKGQLHLVRWLLGNRQVQISQELLDDAFCKACAGGHLDTVKHFFETAGLRQSPNNRRGVVSACENGRTEVVQYFLEPRFAPLSLFGESGRCRPEAFNRFCDCPLVCAVEKRQTDVVRLLVLQAPADFAGSGPARPAPPATLSSGLDPRVHKDLALMVAIENESAVLIRLLVAAVGPQAVLENASSVEYRLRHRPCAAATLIDLGFRDLFDEDAVENLHDQGHLDTLLVLFEKGVVEVTEKWVARARKFEWLSLLKEVAGDAVETVLQEMRWWEGGR